MNGIILIDKPTGPSSMDIVRRIRTRIGVRRAGHSGTLDPEASGLLIIALGHATRLLPFLPLEPKVYQFDIVFGTETDTLDNAGRIIGSGGRIPTREELLDILPRYLGDIRQKPPRFSALKIDGVRAYHRARRDEPFEPRTRIVHIVNLMLRDFDERQGRARLEMHCGSGTYVRSLARDIAYGLDSLAHAENIRRTALGSFSVDSAITPDVAEDQLLAAMQSARSILQAFPAHTASTQQCDALSHGRDITIDSTPEDVEQLFVYDSERRLIAATVRVAGNVFHPMKVFEGL